MKRNKGFEQLEKKIEAKYRLLFWRKLSMVCQLVQDAAMMAANDTLQMGSGRVEAFARALTEYVNEMSGMMMEDQKDDKDYVYTREKVDDRLRQICGEHFKPWEVRYGETTEPV